MAAEHVRIHGLQVDDPALYRRYRDGMTPILHRFGGAFGYDFGVAEVLKAETDQPMNRVFTIRFPDRGTADRFFADPDYLSVRTALFGRAVSHVTVIASFDG